MMPPNWRHFFKSPCFVHHLDKIALEFHYFLNTVIKEKYHNTLLSVNITGKGAKLLPSFSQNPEMKDTPNTHASYWTFLTHFLPLCDFCFPF